MPKKRTSLDSILTKPTQDVSALAESSPKPAGQGKRPGIKQQTVYLPDKVHEQLRRLAFEERARMHDYLLEGLDRVFRARGIPAIEELVGDHTLKPKP